MSSRRQYSVAVRNSATNATAGHAALGLWNNGSGNPIYLKEIWGSKTAAVGDFLAFIRNTTRGTPASTVTPTAATGTDMWATTTSGLVDLGAYSVQPTLDGSIYMIRDTIPASIGAAFKWIFPRPIEIASGSGVVIVTPVNTILQPYDFTVVWEE